MSGRNVTIILVAVLVLFIANKLQGAMFKSFEEMGGEYYSMGRAVLVGIGASFVLMFVLILLVAIFGVGVQPPANA